MGHEKNGGFDSVKQLMPVPLVRESRKREQMDALEVDELGKCTDVWFLPSLHYCRSLSFSSCT